MKRYDCYYKNDFNDKYPAFSEESEDGDWVRWDDAEKMRQALKEIARGKAPEDYGRDDVCAARLSGIARAVLEDL